MLTKDVCPVLILYINLRETWVSVYSKFKINKAMILVKIKHGWLSKFRSEIVNLKLQKIMIHFSKGAYIHLKMQSFIY